MQVLLLGPVAVHDGDHVQPVRSARQAAVLALLASRRGRPVARDTLIDAVWGEEPPPTARNTLQVHISGLRRLLGTEAVTVHGDSYQLTSAVPDTDLDRFRRMSEEGQAMFETGRLAEAARALRAALALWRGDALGGLDSSWAEEERTRLAALRLQAETTRLDADLALGRHLLVLEQLAQLCAEHPYDEGLVARLMLALYRGGRQQEALAVFDRMRRRLVDELGIEPGPELQARQQQVLAQDAGLNSTDSVRAGQAQWRAPVLTAPRDPILGRGALLAEITDRVAPGQLLTLVGPSGIGKSRLALDFARRAQADYRRGAVVVDAAALGSVEDLLLHLAAQLDAGSTATPADVATLLDEGDLLVVLDDPPRALTDVIAGQVHRTRASWLATAHRPLGIEGETVLPVPPLTTGLDDCGNPGPAVELLLARALTAGAGLDRSADTLLAAARCTELLDGIPLALELAAPEAVLGLADLAERLHRDRIAGEGSVAVSFRASLAQLAPDERAVLDALVVASAKLDLELLADLGLPGLDHQRTSAAVAALVRDGLVRRTAGSHGFALFDLLDSIAEQARHQLTPARHAECARALVAAAARVFAVDQYLPSQLRSSAQARRWVALDGFGRQMIDEACEQGLLSAGAAVLTALAEQVMEDRALAPDPWRPAQLADQEALGPDVRADLHLMAAMCHGQLGHAAEAEKHFLEAGELAGQARDPARVALVMVNRCVTTLQGWGDFGDTTELGDRALDLAREHGSTEVLAAVMALRSPAAFTVDTSADAVLLARQHGLVGLELLALANCADHALEDGRLDDAERLALRAAALASDLHNACMNGFMVATLDAARAVAGSGTSLGHVARTMLGCWEVREMRGVSDALLKLAAGARLRHGSTLPARCLGLYDALLADQGLSPAPTEEAMAQRWLAGVVPQPPAEVLDAALRRVALEFTAPPSPALT